MAIWSASIPKTINYLGICWQKRV